MKSLILTTLSLLITLGTFAQAPDGFSYQAVIRDANSNLVTDKNIGVQISILKDSVTGIPVYTERHTSKTNQNGLLTLQVGNGTVTIGDFSFIDWSKTTFFIKTEIDLLGGTNYTQSGTSQLLSVPYALHAKTAETAENIVGDYNKGLFKHYIGEYFEGGVIFHLWKDSLGEEHGLIVDIVDLGEEVWSNKFVCLWPNNNESCLDSLNVGADSRWDGLSNSNKIVSLYGLTNNAAALCLNSKNGGYDDWYLPAIQELNLIWNNYYTVSRSLSQISGATQLESWIYWSSTEIHEYMAWPFDFSDGGGAMYFSDWYDYYNKDYTTYVRAVRAF
jgi:hypothetical protein